MMKCKTKKVLSVFCILVILLTFSVSVFAESSPQPRWKQLSTFAASLERKNGLLSNARVFASADSYNGTTQITLTVTIQKWNGSSYVNTSYTWSSSGRATATVDKNISLASGNYIAHCVATVYDANGNYVETATKDTNEIII